MDFIRCLWSRITSSRGRLPDWCGVAVLFLLIKHADEEMVVNVFWSKQGSFYATDIRQKEKGAPGQAGAPSQSQHSELAPIVIAVIPIAIGMPAAAVFVPPAVPFSPATFPRLMQFVPGVVRLSAVPAVMLDGFVESVVRLGDAALASIVIIGSCPGYSRKCQHAQERRRYKQGPSEKLFLPVMNRHISSILQISPHWDGATSAS